MIYSILFIQVLATLLVQADSSLDLPLFWNETDNLHDFPLDDEGRITVNPFNYKHRLALYHELLSKNEHCLWNDTTESKTEIEKSGSPVWGLIIQHGWQFSSDRLCIPSDGSKGFEFESDCWWGCGNYFFSVVTYFGAQKAGIVEPIYAENLDKDQDFLCHTLEECESKGGPTLHAINQWANLFEYLKETKNNCKPGDLPDPKSPFMDETMKTYWNSHVSSIAGVAQCGDPSISYNSVESKYGNSWVTIVQLLADMRFNVNYTMTVYGQLSFLPPRLLSENDIVPFIPEFNLEQNLGILGVELIDDVNKASDGWLEKGFELITCSPEGRESARNLVSIQNIEQLAGNLTSMVEAIWSPNKDCHDEQIYSMVSIF